MAATQTSETQPAENANPRTGSDPCTATTDVSAPAGSKNSLGAKSDCNGRPSTDDSIVEAMDEQGPAKTPPAEKR